MLTQFFGQIKDNDNGGSWIDTSYASSNNFTATWNDDSKEYEITLGQYIAARPVVLVNLEEDAGSGQLLYQSQRSKFSTTTNQTTIYVKIMKIPLTDPTAIEFVKWRFSFAITTGSTVRAELSAANPSLAITSEIIPFGASADPLLVLSTNINGTTVALDEGTVLQIAAINPEATQLTIQLTDTSITYGEDTYTVQGYTYAAGNSAPVPWADNRMTIDIPAATGVPSPFNRFLVVATNDSTGAVLRSDPLVDVEKKGS